MVPRTGVVARLTLIGIASIMAIPGSAIAMFRTSAALADSAIAPPACAQVPLAASTMEAQREVFPPAVRRASAGSTAADSAVVGSTAAVAAVAIGKAARDGCALTLRDLANPSGSHGRPSLRWEKL